MSRPLPTVLVIGFGYGGMTIAAALKGKARLIFVEKKAFLDHAIGSLRPLAVTPEEITVFESSLPLDKAVPHAVIVQDTAVEVSPSHVRLASGAVLRNFDFLVIATGARHVIRTPHDTISQTQDWRAQIRSQLANAKHALIIGGGPVAVELVGELATYQPHLKLSLATSGPTILDRYSKFKNFDKTILAELKLVAPELQLFFNTKIDSNAGSAWTKQAFTFLPAPSAVGPANDVDVIVNAVGVQVDTSIFSAEFQKDARGFLKVTEQLNIPGHPKVFVLGDIGTLEFKFAYLLDSQAAVVAKNIKSLAKGGRASAKYADKAFALAIPVGPEHGNIALNMGFNIKLGRGTIKKIKGKTLMTQDTYKKFSPPAKPADIKAHGEAREALGKLVAEGNAETLKIVNAPTIVV